MMTATENLFEQILTRKQQEREKEREELLSLTIDVLKRVTPQFSVTAAYITGSLVVTGRFHSHSDIDIAVEGLTDKNYFTFMAKVQQLLPRQVEIIELENCTFAQKIFETGLKVL
jgi:uncharacterized protein